MVSLFPIYSDVCLIHSYYSFISLICFDIHAFISKLIHHLNVRDKTSGIQGNKNERSGLLKEEIWEVISEKHIKNQKLIKTCLEISFTVTALNLFGITMMAA